MTVENIYAILSYSKEKVDPVSKGKISRHKAGTPTHGKLTLFLPKEIIIVFLNILLKVNSIETDFRFDLII